MKLKIRKGAQVEVITGADRGKKGTVLDIDSKNMKIRVQGIRIQTKHSKQDGIVKQEGYVAYSNVKLVEQAKKKAAPKKKKAAKKTAAK